MLKQILDYIQLHGRVSLLDLTRHFRIQESAMQQMLSLWIKKGRIKQINLNNSNCTTNKNCSDCIECDSSAYLIYGFVDNIE